MDTFATRNRYQRGSTSRCGQITPLTVVNGPEKLVASSSGSVAYMTVLYSWNGVSFPAPSRSKLRSQSSSGISYFPDGRPSRSSVESRIRYRPLSPTMVFHREIGMAWSWYHSAVARWSFAYSATCA
ncbi:hypothetical protein [Catenuloplanes niger]